MLKLVHRGHTWTIQLSVVKSVIKYVWSVLEMPSTVPNVLNHSNLMESVFPSAPKIIMLKMENVLHVLLM